MSSETITILYEDDDLIAVEKPAGVPCIPERYPGRPDLHGIVSAQRNERLFVVHRLDREVSGVLLFARNEPAHRHVNRQFMDRKVRKTYAALAIGSLPEEEGIIDAPIRQFGSGRMGVDRSRGKPSRTFYRVQGRLPGHSALQIQPVTGRRHQIRVHLYSIGHPVAGDLLYGDRTVQSQYPRLMLHAETITLERISGGEFTVISPCSREFREGFHQFEGTTHVPHPPHLR